MADLTASIDRVSAAFAEAVQAGKVKIAGNIAAMLENGATAEQIAQALSGLTVDDLLLASGLDESVEDLGRAYATQVLANMQQFAPVSESVLAALVEADRANYLQFVRGEMEGLKRALQQLVLTGGDTRAIRAVASVGQTRAQVEALVNTSMNTFSRTVTAVQAEAAPPETLYVYDGPVDGRTRDLCLKLSAAGELTKAEIDRAFPGAFRDGGGFNCRHQWLPVGTTARRYADAAQKAIADRGAKWKDPLTLQQQLEARQ